MLPALGADSGTSSKTGGSHAAPPAAAADPKDSKQSTDAKDDSKKSPAHKTDTGFDIVTPVEDGLKFIGGLFGIGGGSAAPKEESKQEATAPAPDESGGAPSTSDNLRDGSHQGALDDRIDALKSDLDGLNIKKTAVDIGGLASAVVPGFGFMAKGLLDHFIGNDIDKEKAQKEDQLKHDATLNFLSETLYALGAPTSVVGAIDGKRQITVVADDKLDSDAAYDPKTGTIMVSQSIYDETSQEFDKAQQQGIANSDGTIKDAQKLADAPMASIVAKTASLIGAHETTHATQDDGGVVALFNEQEQRLRQRLEEYSNGLQGQDLQDFVARGKVALDKLEIRMLEVPAYHKQEITQLATGTPGRMNLTVDANGDSLPMDQAVDNVYAFENDLPLPYGPTAGKRKSDFSRDETDKASGFLASLGSVFARIAAQATATAAAAASGTDVNGGRFPGEMNGGRFPGEINGGRFPGDIDGGRFPGEINGGRFPGEINGGRFPGDIDGGRFPGEINGGRFPGDIDGGRFPGDIDGGRFPGEINGGRFPGEID